MGNQDVAEQLVPLIYDELRRIAGARKVEIDAELLIRDDRIEDVIALDDILERLSAMDPHQGRIVELRFFAGLNVEETAEVMGISARTVKREWRSAKAWLEREPGAVKS